MKAFFYSLTLIGLVFPGYSQNSCLQSKKIIDVINLHHLNSREIDDSLSARIFSRLFYEIDKGRDYFSEQDINQLSSLRFKLDDEIKGNKCDFISSLEKIYIKKIAYTRSYLDSLLLKPFNYSTEEFYGLSYETNDLFLSESQRKLKLRLELKYEILNAINQKYKIAKVNPDVKSFTQFENEARTKIKNKKLHALNRIIGDQKILSELIARSFLKSLASSFDPHTEYFSKEEIKEFEASISTEELSFGIDVSLNKTDEISITQLIPGGPAWSTNELHSGDVILEMQSERQKYDLLDLDEDEVKSLLKSPDIQKAVFKVRKSSGEIRDVSLVKSKVENSDNLISSFVLKGEKKIGYINLPGFFTDVENETRQGCANAVAKEILKLKSENIEGLILDLRFNGGGSMLEAIELAGIFIDYGPLALIQEKDKPPVILKDINRGMSFTGPLAIMVNSGSASASELVAAALQDYNRAIIIGSTTYGKATGQIVLPVDATNEEDGFVKVTIERICRVTGASIQQSGVNPDVVLPDFIDLLVEKEKALAYSLSPQSVTKKVYYTPLPALSIQPVGDLSKKRVDSSSDFNSIRDLSKLFSLPIPLEQKAFVKFSETLESTTSSLSKNDSAPYEVLNPKSNESFFALDDYHEEINKRSKESIGKSFYIKEAYFTLNDFINTVKK